MNSGRCRREAVQVRKNRVFGGRSSAEKSLRFNADINTRYTALDGTTAFHGECGNNSCASGAFPAKEFAGRGISTVNRIPST
jgi:hypothetical protein